MANISKIKIPGDNTEYTIKDNSQSRSNHNHYDSDMVPLVHKKYESTSYYGTTNDWENTSWYFMSVKPDEWYKPWRVKLKVHTYCPAYSGYHSYTWSTVCGRETSMIYADWNEKYNSAHTYLTFYPLKKAGFDANYGHAIGISIYNADSRTSSAYYRTFEIDYYECENCTVTILDTPVKWSNWTGTGTTNYGSLATLDATTRGLCETNDANTTTENRIAYFAGKTGAKGVWATGLFMEDAYGTYQNICTASDGTVTSSNRTTATTKIANTNGFKVGGTIWLTNTTYAANSNINGSSVVYSATSVFDTRYSFNTTLTAGSLTVYKPLYLVGTINSTDNLFYLDTVWWTQTPNDTSKIYVLVGGVYDSTTSYCRATLYEQNKWYRYNGSSLVEIVNEANMVNGHTVDKDVPANAKFTDTTYTGTGLISINSSNVISTTAEANQNAFSNVKVGSTTVAADTKTDTLELAGSNVTLTPDATNDKVTIGITSSNVTTALGYTPYNNTNPNGYTKVESSTNGKIKINGTDTTVYTHPGSGTNPHGTTAADVGAIPTSSKGTANGVAELDANGLVPTSQLPSFVDDVLEYSSQSAFPATGETGKIYVALDTNLTYRWSGTAYVEISPSLALGETSSTAYRGDRGKIAYDHSQSTHARTDATAVSFTRNLTSGTKIGTITINGTGTNLYCETNTDTKVRQTLASDNYNRPLLMAAAQISTTTTNIDDATLRANTIYANASTGTIVATKLNATAGINANTANASNAGGVSLYSTDPTAYGITMRGTSLGKYGAVQGDWAGYLCFSGALNRGWIYRHAGTNVASINGEGHIVTNGSITLGGNFTNTSGCKMEFNSTTQSLDFIFA